MGEMVMHSFHGKLLIGERVLFRRVSGVYEEDDGRGVRSGHLEVHEGSTPMLMTNRPYHLALDDGRNEEIYITGLRQSGTAGVTMLAFRAPGGHKARTL
jgi:hypothetical protein